MCSHMYQAFDDASLHPNHQKIIVLLVLLMCHSAIGQFRILPNLLFEGFVDWYDSFSGTFFQIWSRYLFSFVFLFFYVIIINLRYVSKFKLLWVNFNHQLLKRVSRFQFTHFKLKNRMILQPGLCNW